MEFHIAPGCSQPPQAALAVAAMGADSFTFHQENILGTSYDLHVVAPSHADADAANAAALGEIERLRKILSTYDPASDISKINASRDPVKVAPELVALLKLYDLWHAKTQGAYSADLGAWVQLWKNAEAAGTLPAAQDLAPILQATKSPLFTINEAAGTVQRLANRPINIDSLGKGFIVSQAAAVATQQSPAARGLLLNIGGDIAAAGYSMLDRKVKWPIAVADPLHPAENASPIVRLSLSNMSVATSGGYARGYAIDGQRLSHIIDPRSGKAVDVNPAGAARKWSVASATVVAADNATANALATTLCVLTPEEGLALIKATPGTECFLVLADGAHLRSDGFHKFEVPSASSFEQSMVADQDGERWPLGFEVAINLQVKPETDRNSERPYAAVWIEDDRHQHVTTLAVWGNDPKWLQDMPGWWKFGRMDQKLVASVTRATRPAGKYAVVWNGKDRLGRPVPKGEYTVYVEVDYDHGGRVFSGGKITCRDAPAATTIDASEVFDAVEVAYESRTATASR